MVGLFKFEIKGIEFTNTFSGKLFFNPVVTNSIFPGWTLLATTAKTSTSFTLNESYTR